jgi:hypothetical protein
MSVRLKSESLSLLLLSIEDSLLLGFAANVNSQQLYVFTLNINISLNSTNTSNNCCYLFPYFPWLESSLDGEAHSPAPFQFLRK